MAADDTQTPASRPVTKLGTLPGDDVRQILWRFSDRFDLQMLVQSTRQVARGTVARLVADGARNTHEWTEDKSKLLEAFDAGGVTTAFMDPEYGGYIEGPKNLALALAAFEFAWVDGGAATCSLANNLALSPIHERGTPEQRQEYMTRCVPPLPGEDRRTDRGAFALTEPLPYVGVDTGVLAGKIRVAEWNEGEEPILQVDKRGRFITNMAFATFVTAAVDSDDDRFKGSCMVVVEEQDEGLFDRGVPTRKLVHQLSSTRDPVISVKIPASRIIGGYEVKNGTIVPRYNHSAIIEAVFRRTRVTVGLMTAAKLLSAVEPVIRYQRQRFRGGAASTPGSPKHDLGLQQREDALHRLVDVWATGEAACSFGFAAAREFDEFDPLEKRKEQVLAEQGVAGGRAELRALRQRQADAVEWVALAHAPAEERDEARHQELSDDVLVQYLIKDAVTNVLCPAVKLWNTGHGANMMREAVSLMGGYGITEDCPGFLGHKWMDAQLEATYEGPEAVQRRQLSLTMTNEIFLALLREWTREMRTIAASRPGTGACTVASAMELWLWTYDHLVGATDSDGHALYHNRRHGVTFAMADALSWLLACRYQILDLVELEKKGPDNPVVAEGLEGLLGFFGDLAHVQAARATGEVGRICSELVFGYNRHPAWSEDFEGHYFGAGELDALEGVAPGIHACARAMTDVYEDDGSHAQKAGPCVRFEGMQTFQRMRTKLDGCLTGARLAKDRAAQALTEVMIPEILDYPA
jgi:alkylation response protein AidB-like acyl-CoA dehydrogenase